MQIYVCASKRKTSVFCVVRQFQCGRSTIYVCILTPDMELSIPNCQRTKRQTAKTAGYVHKSNAAVKVRFIVAQEIAWALKCFSEGAFVMQCMLKVCQQVYPDQIQTFKYVSLSRNTITDRVKELSGNQLAKETDSYLPFSLAVDESTDNTDTVQL